ncbi:MAG: hypothetical protein GY803_08615 [Chloroflexi bacterium]|nr:hypothetical protein [Chloroflexota bacterium]
MSSLIRPLWKLLWQTAVPNNDLSLTCADCFAILEYLADISSNHNNRPALLQKARSHLTNCPDCHAYYEKRLQELEAMEDDVR